MNGESRFDPDTGHLALTPPALSALATAATDGLEGVGTELLDELQAGSLLVGEGIHPRLVALARCVARSHARLVLDQYTTNFQMQGWVDDRIAVLARASVARPLEAAEVVVVPRGMVPLRLAKLIGLGPRQRVKVSEPAELDQGLLETLLVGEEGLSAPQIQSLSGETDELIPEWLDVLAALSSGASTRWQAGTWWNSPEESPRARSLEVVEGAVGSFLVTHSRRPDSPFRRATLRPLTGTALWRLLCGLVPGEDDVAEPLRH